MQQTTRRVSKLKVVLLWALLLGNLVFWVSLVAWRHRNDPTPASGPEGGVDPIRFIFMFIVGGFFLAAGAAAYAIVLLTNCFTFDFQRPFFSSYKGKLYVAKIFIPILVAVGLALILGVFLEPVMRAFGLRGQITFLVPLFAAIIGTQIVQMWVDIWTPLTRKLIAKRLAARGILPAQLQSAVLVGISDPGRSSFKKLTLVEDDIGALWIGGPQLVYWGDADQFGITPAQIVQLERRADAGNTSMLSGTAHVILHLRLPDGGERQIRFHTEGHWTLGGGRRAMDELSAAITAWHDTATRVPPPPAPAN